MRRADRLFQIVQLLRRRRTVTTAKQIAEKLEISERTVYRDVRDLILAGTPIDGEAGVGYRIRPGYDLPPLMFDREEIQALVLGARIVRQVGDPSLVTQLPGERQPLLRVLPCGGVIPVMQCEIDTGIVRPCSDWRRRCLASSRDRSPPRWSSSG